MLETAYLAYFLIGVLNALVGSLCMTPDLDQMIWDTVFWPFQLFTFLWTMLVRRGGSGD